MTRNTVSIKKNPKLWESIHKKLKQQNNGKWSARLSQQLVQEYKRRGGKFIGPRSKSNSLVKWTKEDWGYSGKSKRSRYLPKKIRSILHRSKNRNVLRYENRLKSNKLGRKIKYSKKLRKVMRSNKIF